MLIAVYAITIIGFVLIPGVDDQGNPYRMGFFHAFYFVSFMGSTIGFGEIPYAFTEAQRFWATFGIYATVITWLYGIGSLLSTLQDPAIRTLLTDAAFRRRVKNLRGPFYLICGYGDTGELLVRALAKDGKRSVVIDDSQERINLLELDDDAVKAIGKCGGSDHPETLIDAGITSPLCLGVVALTNNDTINLKIALATHMLSPTLTMISRVETRESAKNIASFGHNTVINPFDTFAGRLAMALHSPGMYILYEWLTGVPDELLHEPLFPPHGHWILCSYGRFGKAVHERLVAEGISPRIIEAFPEENNAPDHTIIGNGTDAETLKQAGVLHATGIVAGTDNDANNLSIIMTARELNPNLFTVARQNRRRNDVIFEAANLDLVMQRGSVTAHKIYALIRTPLIGNFLKKAHQRDNAWANQLVSRISGVVDTRVPQLWEVTVNSSEAPGIWENLQEREFTMKDLLCDPRNRKYALPAIPLLVHRDGEDILLPDNFFSLKTSDRILMCGSALGRKQMEWAVNNYDVARYLATGEEHPSSYLGRWINSIHAVSNRARQNGLSEE